MRSGRRSSFLFGSGWTLESYGEVQERSDYLKHFSNSVVLSLGSTLFGLIDRRASRLGDGVSCRAGAPRTS